VPMLWSRRLPDSIRVMALDPSRTMLDAARARLDEALQRRVFFVPQPVNALSYADGVFNAAVCVEGVVTRTELKEGLSELTRVVEPGGRVLLSVPAFDCFGVLYDMLDEALKAHQLDASADRLAQLRETFINSQDLYACARDCDLHDLDVSRHSWQITFESGSEAVMSPLIRQTFFSHWMSIIRSSEREPVMRYLIDAIDTYFHERLLTLEVVALTLRGAR
jgi:SAM-dependent methyltransferase